MKHLFFAILALSVFAACTHQAPMPPVSPLVFVGTYTQKLGHVDGKASGIYVCRFDTASGALTVVDSATDLANPSFLTLSPNKTRLYAVGENGGKPEQPFGSVAAYQASPEGKLLKINEVSSYGVAPCHISTDLLGQFVFVANYVTGNVLSYGIRPDGGLSDSLCQRQHPGEHPWAHQVLTAPNNHLLWAVDKGADRVFAYNFGGNGRLEQAAALPLPKDAGPRHLDFCPADPTLMAVINELSCSVLTFRYDESTKQFTRLDSLSTLPVGFAAQNTCADIHFHPNGKFLYGSNRGHDSIVIYAIDPASGKLTLVGHQAAGGAVPRNFMLTPDGRWMLVAHQNSSTVSAFRVDAVTGRLTPAGAPSRVATPVCLKM
jgi:6-phosphogluconolactonase